MAALSATLKSARRVMVVDHHQDRLKLAEKIGLLPLQLPRGEKAGRFIRRILWSAASAEMTPMPRVATSNRWTVRAW